MSKSDIKNLEKIKTAAAIDFTGPHGSGIFWILKRIILQQEKRILDLEFKVTEIRGEVENDES